MWHRGMPNFSNQHRPMITMVVKNEKGALPRIEATHPIDWDLMNIQRYVHPHGWLNYFSSRGCPGGCTFCAIYCLNPHKWTAYGPARVVAPALTAYAAAFLIASHSTGDLGFLGSGLMAGIGHGYCFPVLTSLVVSRVSDEHRGSGVAMFTALWGISSLVFSPLFGSLADHTDDQMMFWVAAAMAGVAMIQWRVLERRYGEAG